MKGTKVNSKVHGLLGISNTRWMRTLGWVGDLLDVVS